MMMKFYKCAVCGQIVAIVQETGAPLVCCGEEMDEIIPGSMDASIEKHVPVIEVTKDTVTVKVGSEPHPMTEKHWIEWVCLETTGGNQRKLLKPGDNAEACFKLCEGDRVIAAYSYCNLHGLWKAECHPV